MPNSLTPLPCAATPAPAVEPISVVSISAGPQQSADEVVSQLATAVKGRDATIATLFVYGDVAAREATTRSIRRYLGALDWPVLWVEGRSCNGAPLAGVQAFVVRGTEVERVLVKGRVVATTFRAGDARHCLLAGIGPDDAGAPCEAQAQQAFENIQAALSHAGFDIADLARTWFYNRGLLDWYDAFNRVRTRFYARRPFASGCVPASTGVEGRNPAGAALAFAAWAVQPLARTARVIDVASPLQCTALRYGSSFSRAVEIQSAHGRRLLVSGTASIAPGGESIWRGDIGKQIATTMDVVEALLKSRGMHWGDVGRATAYFKYPLDAAAFAAWQEAHRVSLPVICVHCDICRHDLLFEIEVDASRRTKKAGSEDPAEGF